MGSEIYLNNIKGWGDCSFSFVGGRINKGFVSFKFDAEIDLENIHADATNRKPVGIGYGDMDFSGEVGVLFNTYLKLREIANATGYNTLQYLPFSGVLSWRMVEDNDGFPKYTHNPLDTFTFVNAAFTKLSFDGSQGNKNIIVPLPFIAGDIQGI